MVVIEMAPPEQADRLGMGVIAVTRAEGKTEAVPGGVTAALSEQDDRRSAREV
jgi:hypothetical protein